ncbi:udp-glucose 4-epimerase [Grosmannia clavigera kw1407]|uniref:Udp-glucose 4-epimerase n=1 Tax=Grosmannia clavigera (strain kw1407 / UAMH 11150) TaxID=655863 RepID=F0XBL3_GROCL|nr:udp-glucose 4-epimerase [Grosmannia clavigera kw1407]EFX04886.1 udp-glucose 4-epimerase [Grosmannia clavigera kw1407]
MNRSYPASEYSGNDQSRSTTSCPPTPATETSDFDAAVSDVSLSDILPIPSRDEYVLVTGGLGFIGSHTTVELLKAGYNVIIVDDLSNSYRHVLDGIHEVARLHYAAHECGQCPVVEYHNINYRDLPAMQNVLELHSSIAPSHNGTKITDIVGVIHFAAYKTVHESICQPLKYYKNNVNGFVDLLALLEEFSIKTFIFSSSAVVYGYLGQAGRTLLETNCLQSCEQALESEDSERQPQSGCVEITNPYGRSKFFAEAILSDLVVSDPSWNIVVLRYFNPIGCDSSGLLAENPKGESLNLLPLVTQTMTGARKELLVFGGDWNTPDGTAMRDFIHVSDLARGHTAALSACREGRLKGSYRTFNLGVGKGCSILEVIRAMESVSGRKIPWQLVDRRPGDVESSIAAVGRAQEELGWKAEKSLRDACWDICHYLNLI